MKVISLINQKGGVGKTTSAISIASYLGREKRVLLVDLDPQGNATSNCGVDEENLQKTVKDLILEDKTPASECVVKTEKGFDLIGSNIDVADTELNMVSKLNRENLLRKKLKTLDYDYVIMDCSPSLNLMTINALVATDLALIPIEPHIFSVKGISSLMDTIENIRPMNENIQHKFFITKFDGRNSSFKMIEDISEVRELFVETLNLLELSETLTEQDLALLRRDADNFVIVAMNWKKLYAFDDLLQIQSLNENQMVIIPAAIMEGNGTKQILVGTNQKKTEEYKSWQELVNNINRNIGLKTENSVNKIFESKLSNEINQNIEKVNKINQLKNQQQQLNQDIQSKQNLLKIADPNSPAQEKLQSELDKLNSDLDINLQELDMLVNQ